MKTKKQIHEEIRIVKKDIKNRLLTGFYGNANNLLYADIEYLKEHWRELENKGLSETEKCNTYSFYKFCDSCWKTFYILNKEDSWFKSFYEEYKEKKYIKSFIKDTAEVIEKIEQVNNEIIESIAPAPQEEQKEVKEEVETMENKTTLEILKSEFLKDSKIYEDIIQNNNKSEETNCKLYNHAQYMVNKYTNTDVKITESDNINLHQFFSIMLVCKNLIKFRQVFYYINNDFKYGAGYISLKKFNIFFVEEILSNVKKNSIDSFNKSYHKELINDFIQSLDLSNNGNDIRLSKYQSEHIISTLIFFNTKEELKEKIGNKFNDDEFDKLLKELKDLFFEKSLIVSLSKNQIAFLKVLFDNKSASKETSSQIEEIAPTSEEITESTTKADIIKQLETSSKVEPLQEEKEIESEVERYFRNDKKLFTINFCKGDNESILFTQNLANEMIKSFTPYILSVGSKETEINVYQFSIILFKVKTIEEFRKVIFYLQKLSISKINHILTLDIDIIIRKMESTYGEEFKNDYEYKSVELTEEQRELISSELFKIEESEILKISDDSDNPIQIIGTLKRLKKCFIKDFKQISLSVNQIDFIKAILS